MPERTIIIGDVHGCYRELENLVDRLAYRPGKDRLVFIGDLVNKGPNSLKVYETFKQLKAEAVLGNHEWYLIEQHEERKPKWGGYDHLVKEFGRAKLDAFVQDAKTWPLYIKEKDFTIVHAGKVPNKRFRDSSARELTTIRTWGKRDRPWYDYYKGKRLVVFGHWAALNGLDTPRVIGLDTGCVYGGALSAVILPERRFVRVKAEKVYCPITV